MVKQPKSGSYINNTENTLEYFLKRDIVCKKGFENRPCLWRSAYPGGVSAAAVFQKSVTNSFRLIVRRRNQWQDRGVEYLPDSVEEVRRHHEMLERLMKG